MNGMIDLHHHLLYGMDDGPQSFDEMAAMLRRAAQEGVACITATPHVHPGHEFFDAARFRERLMQARAYAQREGLNVQVLPGAEVRYSGALMQMLERGEIPPLGDSWHVLVEFHPYERYEAICGAAVHMANVGYSMVLAHAERYRCLRWGRRLRRLREEYHVLVQMNADTLVSRRGGLFGRWLDHCMREGLVDLVASDAHDLEQRPCALGSCAAYIEKTWGRETAERVLIQRPEEILTERVR